MPGCPTCGDSFRLGDDYRDHLPCPGSPTEVAYRLGAAKTRSAIEKNIREIANALGGNVKPSGVQSQVSTSMRETVLVIANAIRDGKI